MSVTYNDLETQLVSECQTLIAVIRGVVANWSSGDLAGQVNAAREAADASEDFITNHCGEEQLGATVRASADAYADESADEEQEIQALELARAIARLELPVGDGQDRESYSDDAAETLANLIENARAILRIT
jgi:hypothetical protein